MYVAVMDGTGVRDFWDARAREDAYFFIDDRLDYHDPDMARFWAGGEQDLDRLLELLGVTLTPTDVVVDIGCGVGRLTRVVAERAERVIAIDVSPQMIARAKRHHPELDNVEWIVGDGTSLRPLDDARASVC